MITIILLLCLLKPLMGTPLPSNAAFTPDAYNVPTSLLFREESADQPMRTRYAIVQSCLVTIFACVWKSAHPNISGPRDSGFTRFKRRLTIMWVTLIAPELVLYWALSQRASAKHMMKQYNDKFSAQRDPKEVSIWEWPTTFVRYFTQWFQTLPKDSTRRGKGQAWTITHGFFIQMGGFILYDGEYPKGVLTYKTLNEYIDTGKIDQPTVTERELQDRSKGDAVSKGLILFQMGWFILQCIARAVRHLPLSDLEVLTLAFAAVNGFIYAAWWDKPQGVDTAVIIQLRQISVVADPTEGQPSCESPTPHVPSNPTVDEYTESPTSFKWLRTKLFDMQQRNIVSQVILGVCYSVWWLLRPFYKCLPSYGLIIQEQFRVAVFYRSFDPVSGILFLLVGLLFGAIHLLVWGHPGVWTFDLIIWRVSSLLVIAAPLVTLISYLTDKVKFVDNVVSILVGATFLIYPVARCLIIFVALRTIRNPPADVLIDVPWTTFIPHF